MSLAPKPAAPADQLAPSANPTAGRWSPFQDAYPFWRFEPDLLSLMSRLEQVVASLDGVRGEKRVAASARMASNLINQIFTFSLAKLRTEAHTEAFEKARRAHEAAMALEKDHGWLMALDSKKARPTPAGQPEPPSLRTVHAAVGQGLFDAVGSYFEVFLACFRDRASAGQWAETFHVFLDDLRTRW